MEWGAHQNVGALKLQVHWGLIDAQPLLPLLLVFAGQKVRVDELTDKLTLRRRLRLCSRTLLCAVVHRRNYAQTICSMQRQQTDMHVRHTCLA